MLLPGLRAALQAPFAAAARGGLTLEDDGTYNGAACKRSRSGEVVLTHGEATDSTSLVPVMLSGSHARGACGSAATAAAEVDAFGVTFEAATGRCSSWTFLPPFAAPEALCLAEFGETTTGEEDDGCALPVWPRDLAFCGSFVGVPFRSSSSRRPSAIGLIFSSFVRRRLPPPLPHLSSGLLLSHKAATTRRPCTAPTQSHTTSCTQSIAQ
mmetsp:Transcript_54343/g.142029  ORF Transcript_54343/g.142029 Transcript_54343/m.142029 type:complete len:211 (+) Transcript_54343:2627-3259(+)